MSKRLIAIKCCICQKNIDEARIRQSQKVVTCSKECAAKLKSARRQRYEQKHCRRCGTPCTPEERKEFRAWRIAKGQLRTRRGRPKLTTAQLAAKNGKPVQTEFTEMITV